MDHLWSPWRLYYVTAEKPSTGCVFCQPRPDAAPAAERNPLIVFEGSLAYVILNRYPYNNGHLMVVPNRHLATLVDLTIDELNEIALLTQRSEPRCARPTGSRGSTSDSIWVSPRVEASPVTCTCISFHDGSVTPIS